MTTQIKTSELDFDTLRESLKEYLGNHKDLQDADFEGSVLSQILDVLAYNTHINALTANFSINESFLDSSQLRSSIVSHARPLGYTPNSKTGSIATVDITALAVPDGTGTLTLPKYSSFTASIDNASYTFVNTEQVTADSTTSYIFEDVDIKQGKVKTKSFYVDNTTDDYPIYVIPDENIDTDTMEVVVRDGISSTSIETYTLITQVSELDSDSQVYFLHESPRGYYEIAFGEGIIGKRPAPGSIIEVTYLSTSGADANNAKTFSTSVEVDNLSLSVATVSASAGGTSKETNESIRFNAPLLRASQNRLVTTNDYSAFIQNQVSNIEALNVWGGEDNDPVTYGHVFIAAKPVGSDALSDSVKEQLTTLIRRKSVIDLRTQFVDPTYAYLNISGSVTFDASKTSLSSTQLEAAIADRISTYGTSTLSNFNSTFYLSSLLTHIDDYSDAILGSDASVDYQLRLFPTLGANDTYSIYTVGEIKSPSAVASSSRVIQSTGFSTIVNGETVTAFIRNKSGSTTLEMYYVSGSTEVIISNTGSFDATSGKITVGPFQPSALLSATKGIQFTITPADDAVINPLRNLLLVIDSDESKVVATAK